MRFYSKQHPYYCGIDLHTRKMYVSVLDQAGQVLVHRNLKTRGDHFLDLIRPYRDGVVVGVECMFSWYWLADLCQEEEFDFVLGHALYMRAIHGGKAKNNRIDSKKISYKSNRIGIAERFTDPSVRKMVQLDLSLIDQLDKRTSPSGTGEGD